MNKRILELETINAVLLERIRSLQEDLIAAEIDYKDSFESASSQLESFYHMAKNWFPSERKKQEESSE